MVGGKESSGEDICELTLKEIWKAYFLVRKGAKKSAAMAEFEYGLLVNLRELYEELVSGQYRHGGYKFVELNDKKRRDLYVAGVRDRVVQRLVFDRLVGVTDKRLDARVYSGRKGKGLVAAVKNAQKLLVRYVDGYVWRMDVVKCFENIDQGILRGLLGRLRLPEWLMGAACEIIRSFPRGVPIGNVTSLCFSNIYLNEFDRWVRCESGALDYMRYGDDALVVVRTRHEAEVERERAVSFLGGLGLGVNVKGNVIVPARDGLKYLGHEIVAEGRVVDRWTTNRVVKRVGVGNLASYKSLRLAAPERRRLDYRVFLEVEGVLRDGI